MLTIQHVALRKPGRPRARLLVATLGLTTALTSSLFAQDASDTGTVLSTVLVDGTAQVTDSGEGAIARTTSSATKTQASVERVPQSVSVITREQMDVQGADSIGAAARYTPGIRSEAYGADTRYDWFFLRGFAAQSQGLYLDGLQLRSQAFANFRVEPFGVERQDVLLGPSSALFGAGSSGGLINLTSKHPQKESFTRLSVGGTDPAGGQVAIDVNGALPGMDNVYGRFVALGKLAQTQVEHVDDDRLYLAPSITFEPQDGTRLTVLGSFQRDSTGTVTSFLPYDATVKAASFGRIPSDFFSADTDFDGYDRTQFMIGYEFEHQFDDGPKFSQSTRYSKVSTQYETLYGIGLVSGFFPGFPDTLLARQAMATDDSIGAFQTDNRLEFDLDHGSISHKILAGLDYRHEVFDNKAGYANDPTGNFYIIDIQNPVYGINPSRPAYTTDTRTRSNRIGIYLQDQVALTDKLEVTAGLRNDWVWSTLHNNRTGADTDRDDSALTGRAGISYELFSGFRPYASYATSFDPVAGSAANGTAFEPETAEQFEVGAKYRDPLGRFLLTAAWFDLTRENVLTRDTANPAFNIQTGEVNSQGFELQAQATIAESWDVLASYTRYDLEITRSNNGDIGKVPVGVPQEMASVWLNHRFSGAFEGLRLGGGVRYIGESYADAANRLTVPDYVVADLSLGYKFGNTELSLNASNLFDKTYVAACAGNNSCYYGDRRKIAAKLTFEW